MLRKPAFIKSTRPSSLEETVPILPLLNFYSCIVLVLHHAVLIKDTLLALQAVTLLLRLICEPRCHKELLRIVVEAYPVLVMCMNQDLAEAYNRLFVQLFCSGPNALEAVRDQHALATMLFTLHTVFLLSSQPMHNNSVAAISFKSSLVSGWSFT